MFSIQSRFPQTSPIHRRQRFPTSLRIQRSRFRGIIGFTLMACLTFFGSVAHSDDKEPKDEPDKEAKLVSKKRLGLMQEAIEALVVTSKEIETESALDFVMVPKLRYNDSSRRLLDASVWRLGESGRPTAFVVIELYSQGDGFASLNYEFVTLSEHQFSMISRKGPQWSPLTTETTFEPLPGAPEPNDTEKLRLVQMREIARRFTARERYAGQLIELRLMPQPIDRYKDEEHGITDGATFVFAHGTNPEVGMLLETDGKIWKYGLFRITGAVVSLEFDEKDVKGLLPPLGPGLNRAYSSGGLRVPLPE